MALVEDHQAPVPTDPSLTRLADRFAIQPPIGPIRPLGQGLINDTYRLEAGDQSYVLQRINSRVFPSPERIMANLSLLARHPDPSGAIGPRIPRLIPTREGESFARDARGEVWRLMEFIPNAIGLSRIHDGQQGREVGRVLGRFHRWVGAMPIERFGLSLPGFHATPVYLKRFLTAIENSASAETSAGIGPLMDFVNERRGLAEVLEEANRTGRIALRVTHGDPKLDNILFDEDGQRALALIDLDTVQPGLVQHDLGDCLRSCCNNRGEGDPDPERVRFDLGICESILSGYGEATGGFLTENDIACLPDAIRLMPFELGLRFLTDHLEGDRYFKVDRPGRNLDKARIQFALVSDIERQSGEIQALIGERLTAAARRRA
ncbi:aminoglycoside phosphotransferase [Thiocystis violacea]|nr:aminoglycoside phosphotransferase [Thiocystis violacea]